MTRSGDSPAAKLARFVTETTAADLPATAQDAVVRAITDGIGVTLAGMSHESGRITGRFAGAGPADGLPLGGDTDAECASRALHLGTAAHALDYDDLSWAIDGHPTVALLPPILALADQVAPTGAEVVTAYAVGFETASYLATPISPEHYEAGWHATATFGALGAAATAAALLDLDRDATETALNIAASTPAGLKENFGSMTKPLHAGLAARSGLTSALLAADGFTAGERAIDGQAGFWALYRGEADPASGGPSSAPGREWALATGGIHLKRYPACYFTHSAIAATESIVDAHDVDPGAIETVRVRAAQGADDALAHSDPETALQSKFSMPHAVAVALTADTVGIDWFEPAAVSDETLVARRELVDFAVDDSLPYDSHAATVTVELADDSYRTVQDHPPWTHEHPPTRDELRTKFVEAGTRTVDEATARETFDRLQALPEGDFLEAVGEIRA